MSDIIQLITALAALAAVGLSWVNRKHIQEIHLLINSRMDQLLKLTGEAQHALGVKQEAEREK